MLLALKTVNQLPDSKKLRTFALSKGKKDKTLFNNIKRNTIMEKFDFTFEELVNRLTFTEDDYNKEAELKGVKASFKKFIQDIINYCQKYGCALDDAIFLAEDDFDYFKEFAKKTYDVCFDNDNSSNNEGWHEPYQYCKNYIEMYNGTNEDYFADYKGGLVSIYCNETGKTVYCEKVKWLNIVYLNKYNVTNACKLKTYRHFI